VYEHRSKLAPVGRFCHWAKGLSSPVAVGIASGVSFEVEVLFMGGKSCPVRVSASYCPEFADCLGLPALDCHVFAR
jgi:hypothetical protein